MTVFTTFAVASPGLEGVAAAELAALLGRPVAAEPGGASFEATPAELLAVHARVTIATRVLVRAGTFTAKDFARLVREAAAVDWRRFASGPVRLECHVTAKKSRLYHTGAIAERLATAIARTLTLTDDPAAPVLGLWARVERDVFTLSVDASGDRLHRRGWRLDTTAAPLRETLASGILALARWLPTESLLDPMCGSGTFAIEAATRPLPTARTFACQSWPGFSAPQPEPRPEPGASALFASDADPAAITAARTNAARAQVADRITFTVSDAADAPAPTTPGLIVANPPYDHRLPASRTALTALARLRDRLPDWRLALLHPDPTAITRALGRPRATHRLDNGGLRVTLALYLP